MNLNPRTRERIERVLLMSLFRRIALQNPAHQAEPHNEGATRLHELTALALVREHWLVSWCHRLPPADRGSMLNGFNDRDVGSSGTDSATDLMW
jgi:hypothetical protein